MGDIFDPFAGVDDAFPLGGVPAPAKGVAYTPPPPHLIADALAQVTLAMAQVPADQDGALVAVATDVGTNGALAVRGPAGVNVELWIGKNWGETIHYGAAATKTFKWR